MTRRVAIKAHKCFDGTLFRQIETSTRPRNLQVGQRWIAVSNSNEFDGSRWEFVIVAKVGQRFVARMQFPNGADPGSHQVMVFDSFGVECHDSSAGEEAVELARFYFVRKSKKQ